MPRPVTLFTGQWADLPLEELAQKAADWGYDGLELACWGDHLSVGKAARSKKYCEERIELLDKYGLKCYAISNHLAGQLVCDKNDSRSDMFAPAKHKGKAGAKRKWAIQAMMDTARAAKNEDGFQNFAKLWNPILDVFDKCGVKFALEVHPTEIAFDTVTARRALEAVDNREAFGFNFDPSHLEWQMVDPVKFLKAFPDRIYHVHMKDAAVTLDGESGILSSHLNFGQPGRGWDFRSLGRGDINFEDIIRTLNQLNYTGPLSVEWEDAAMDREHGAAEACEFVKSLDFPSSDRVFDEAFDS